MEILRASLVGLLVGCSGLASAQTWVLLTHKSSLSVAKTARTGYTEVVSSNGTAVYGQSAKTLAVISYRASSGTVVLNLIDKATGDVTTWPISVEPVVDVSGPRESVVLTDMSAYFAVVRDREKEGLNEEGGMLDVDQVSLADGTVHRFPLPADCRNPRLAQLGGNIFVYSFNSSGVWKLDSTKGHMQKMVRPEDIQAARNGRVPPAPADGVAPVKSAELPLGAFADYVVVPSAGVYGLSRYGLLQQVVRPDFAMVNGPRPNTTLGSADKVLRLFAGESKGAPAVGVVRKTETEGMTFEYLDPASLGAIWQTAVSSDAVPESFYPLSSDVVAYVEQKGGSIQSISSSGGSKTLWTLPHDSDASISRILSTDGAQ